MVRRLTTAQAIVKFLRVQYSARDGREQQFFTVLRRMPYERPPRDWAARLPAQESRFGSISRLISNVDAHRRQDTLARLRVGRQPDGFEQVRVAVIEAVAVCKDRNRRQAVAFKFECRLQGRSPAPLPARI
jgi:hypothetical protein